MKELRAPEYRPFENIKHTRNDGSEYWLAREIAQMLDYAQWRSFTKVIDKAMIACNNSGHSIGHNFAEVSKIAAAGATSKPIEDYELSRYACYLIIQNGDPRKEAVALGKTYLAIQTYRRETAGIFDRRDGGLISRELIADLFLTSLTEEKLKRDPVGNASDDNAVHHEVGREVRNTIERIGGTMPDE